MLVFGLGNPKEAYVDTRHNVGRDFIAHLSKINNISYEKTRQADILRLPGFSSGSSLQPLVFVRLKSYMNTSGTALKHVMQAESKTHQDILVLVDDFAIPYGALRLRSSGSSGGHNGLKSIIDVLGTEEFGRLRVGVGPVPEGEDPADFVLDKFSKKELTQRNILFDAVASGLKILHHEGYQKAMAFLNKNHLSLSAS